MKEMYNTYDDSKEIFMAWYDSSLLLAWYDSKEIFIVSMV